MTEFNENFFLENPWESINEPIYPAGRFLRQGSTRFLVSMDNQNRINFFVSINGATIIKQMPKLSGIELSIDESVGNETRLVCTLTDGLLKDKFTLLAKEVAFKCSDFPDSQLLGMCIERIISWANFLKPSREGLKHSEWIGFWGELYTLTNIIYPSFNIKDAIKFWIGPQQKKQDFSFNNVALEIKTTESGDSHEIKISSLDQLHKITNQLFLMHMHINQSDTQIGLSLNDMYNSVIELTDSDTGANLDFVNKTKNLYGKASKNQLETKFIFLEHEIYEVNDKFPSLTKEKNVPSSVMKATYSLDPSQLKTFQVSVSLQDLIKDSENG
jgi:hypothetical protein